MIYTICLLVICLVLLASIIRHFFTFWSRQGVKGPNLFELIIGFNESPDKSSQTLTKRYGKVYGTVGVPNKFLTVNDPELINEICVKHFDVFPDHSHWYIGPSPKVNKMLAFLPGKTGDDWKRVRTVLTRAFTSRKLRNMTRVIIYEADRTVKDLKNAERTDKPIDVREIIEAFSVNVFFACVFGLEIDATSTPDHPAVVNTRKIFSINANLTRITSIMAPKFAALLGMEFFDPNLIEYFHGLTKEALKQRKHELGEEHSNLVQIMMDSVIDEDNSNIDDVGNENPIKTYLSLEELTAQAINFILAGFDTTSAGATHVIYYLAKHHLWQQKIYEEVKDFDDFSYENLNQLKNLNAVISETLRLKPSFLNVPRVSAKDFVLAGIKVPAKTSIIMQPFIINRDPDYWTDPDQFKPERFLDHSYSTRAYFTFGGGPRICIGRKFALDQILICCAKLIKQFEFKLAPGFNMEYYKGSFVLSPKSLMVDVKSRL